MKLQRPFTTAFAIACLRLASGPAMAVLVPQGDFFTDTATGLDWLDVRQTQGLSFFEVDTLLAPGGALEGWRRATLEEFSALMHNIGVPYAPGGGKCEPDFCETDDGHADRGYGGAEIPEIDRAIRLLGDTYDEFLKVQHDTSLRAAPGYTFGMLAKRFASLDTAMVRDGDVFHDGIERPDLGPRRQTPPTVLIA